MSESNIRKGLQASNTNYWLNPIQSYDINFNQLPLGNFALN